jgi:four helix bundle protein
MSLGSIAELETLLTICCEVGYITNIHFSELEVDLEILRSKLLNFIKYQKINSIKKKLNSTF